ncbi:UNVERIFIED_CONTAM: hypothetical protein Sradi_3248200 [Sesamum radiatum]|uniref:CCHC-type domain-containing protein n=1 Tax=Sesamum radiatum TaxID=300843 RepID=A0AAW2QZ61_SESRA
MRTEEANRLKDKELSNPSSNSFKANLVESSNKDRFQNKGKKFQKGGQQKFFKNNDGKIQKNKVMCYCCGKAGHKAYQYYQRKDQQKLNHKPNAQTTPQVNLAETEEVIAAVVVEANLVENKSDWILDTGVSKHFCSNKELFQELKEQQTENASTWGTLLPPASWKNERFFLNLPLKKLLLYKMYYMFLLFVGI